MGDEAQKEKYINSVREKMAQQDKKNLKGWIVDLRGNFGGDMVPMLVAVGPILGEGVLGYFFYPDSSFYTWNYRKNGYFLYDENGNWWERSTDSYPLKSPNPYVAILTDHVTASSGEAVAIAFKGRNKTKSFGTPTFGVLTSNRVHTLSDGSRINLTESVFADRNKTKYGLFLFSVYPDVKSVRVKQNLVEEAYNWISSQTLKTSARRRMAKEKAGFSAGSQFCASIPKCTEPAASQRVEMLVGIQKIQAVNNGRNSGKSHATCNS